MLELVKGDDMKVKDTFTDDLWRFGDFEAYSALAQAIKSAMWSSDTWCVLSMDQCQALEVIADDIARVINGDADRPDPWHNIASYALLIEKRLARDVQTHLKKLREVANAQDNGTPLKPL